MTNDKAKQNAAPSDLTDEALDNASGGFEEIEVNYLGKSKYATAKFSMNEPTVEQDVQTMKSSSFTGKLNLGSDLEEIAALRKRPTR